MDSAARRPSQAMDEYLVVECQLGNADAFNALVRRWQGQFVARAQTFTKDRDAALEIAQESWIGVIRRPSTASRSGKLRLVGAAHRGEQIARLDQA